MAASRAAAATTVRAGRATATTARRTGQGVVAIPGAALRGVRGGTLRAARGLYTVVLFKRPAALPQSRCLSCGYKMSAAAASCLECGEPAFAYLPATQSRARFGREFFVAAGWALTTALIAILGVGLIAASVIVGAAIAAR